MTIRTLLNMTELMACGLTIILVLAPRAVHAQSDPRISLTPSEQIWLKEHPVIRLGVDPTDPPREFINSEGKYSGIVADLARLVSERLGITFVEERASTWAELIEKAKRRELDVLPGVARTKEREEYLVFTKPYLNVPVVIVTRTDAPYIESLENLQGKTVTRKQVSPRLCRGDSPRFDRVKQWWEPPRTHQVSILGGYDERLSEPKPYEVGLQVSCGFHSQTSPKAGLWSHPEVPWGDIPRLGPAKGVQDS